MPIVIIGGVTAVGKTSTARKLSEMHHWDYIEADDFHSTENIQKMHAGLALTDEDRLPWLQRLHEKLKEYASDNRSCVMTCSALKKAYRQILLTGLSESNPATPPPKNVFLIMLIVSRNALNQRLVQRQQEHFMNPLLLDSQLRTLELPKDPSDEPYVSIVNCDDLSHDEVTERIEQVIQKALS